MTTTEGPRDESVLDANAARNNLSAPGGREAMKLEEGVVTSGTTTNEVAVKVAAPKRPYLLVATATVVVVTLVVVLGLVVIPSNQEEETKIPVITLPDVSMNALEDPTSPQSQAYTWLMEDPMLQSYPEWRKLQRFALATFYLALGGENWLQNNQNFLDYNVPECHWFSWGSGLSVDTACNPDGQYMVLIFPDNNLVGTIPPEVSLLHPALEFLVLTSDEIEGTIPSQIGLLTNLKHVQLQENLLTGTLPSQVGRLALLESLVLTSNDLQGPLPTELGLLTNLKRLDLGDNNFTGAIPSELGQLSLLEKLNLEDTTLNGALPSELQGLEVMKVDAPP